MQTRVKKILMIATGGTIACKGGKSGLSPEFTSEEILSFVPSVREFCEVYSLQLMNIDSTNMRPAHWLKIAEAIEENYSSYDGFVILHGTDTMAYTAAALSYLIQNSPKPIVITGAQKPVGVEVTDAIINLYDSFLYSSYSYASGVSIVFDGKVICGTRAKKMRTKSYNAFSSINYPYVATIQDGKIIQYNKSKSSKRPIFYHSLSDKVGLFKIIPGSDAKILDAMFSLNDAVIIESFGTGGIPAGEGYDFYEVIDKWRKKGKTIVMCTQVVSEGSDMTVYKVGKGIKEEYGILESYDMTPEAVVAKLMWILGLQHTPSKIKKLFYKSINSDILYSD